MYLYIVVMSVTVYYRFCHRKGYQTESYLLLRLEWVNFSYMNYAKYLRWLVPYRWWMDQKKFCRISFLKTAFKSPHLHSLELNTRIVRYAILTTWAMCVYGVGFSKGVGPGTMVPFHHSFVEVVHYHQHHLYHIFFLQVGRGQGLPSQFSSFHLKIK